tara:strand:+ start:144 stop:467 length:324 start_codon:yes stop_codon:yes gene_type:complete
MKTPLYTDKGVVVANVINGKLCAYKSEAIHKLRIPEAWAFDETIIDAAEKAGATKIAIVTSDTGKRFTSSMDNFRAKAVSLTRGHGPQLALPMKYWEREDVRQLNLT